MKNIFLFVPVALRDAFSEIQKTRWQKLKSTVRRRLEIELAVQTGRVRFSSYHHMKSYNANRGDLAIAIAIEAQLKKQFGDSACIDMIGWDDLGKFSAKQINSAYDCFVIGGGGYIFLDKAGNLNSRARDYEFLRQLDVPVVAYGIGLNRLMHEGIYADTDFKLLPRATQQYITNLSSCLTAISARDVSTCALFSEVANREVTLTGDPALSIFRNLPDEAQVIDAADTKYFGVNLACHGWRALAVLETIIPSLEQLYSHAISLGYKMKYFIHDDSEVSIVEYLRRRGLDFTVFKGAPSAMVAEYHKMSFVVSQMLHSSIMAFSAGVPTLNIAYDTKNAAFYQLFDLEEFSVPWRKASFDHLANLLGKLIAKRDVIGACICGKRDHWISAQEVFLGNHCRPR